MALQTNGKISISDILEEMGADTTVNVNLNDLALKWLIRTGKNKFRKENHRLSDWYGETWYYNVSYGYYSYFRFGRTYSYATILSNNTSSDIKSTDFNDPIGSL